MPEFSRQFGQWITMAGCVGVSKGFCSTRQCSALGFSLSIRFCRLVLERSSCMAKHDVLIALREAF